MAGWRVEQMSAGAEELLGSPPWGHDSRFIYLYVYNYIYMKYAEINVYRNKSLAIIPGYVESDEHKKLYYAEQDYNLANLQHENLQRNTLKIQEYINTNANTKIKS